MTIFSKTRIQGELDLAGNPFRRWAVGIRVSESNLSEHRIDLGDVDTVEQVEEFSYHVETFSRRQTGNTSGCESPSWPVQVSSESFC